MSRYASCVGAFALVVAGSNALAADLLGTVTRSGRPQVGVEVSLLPASVPSAEADGAKRTATTNSAGNYLFQDIRPGNYLLKCNGGEKRVTVRQGAKRQDCKD